MGARRFAYGEAFDALQANTFATHARRPTPVGVFVHGDTPEGVYDMAGNSSDWTTSSFGRDEETAEHRYPYDATDGRERTTEGAEVMRVVRGGTWFNAIEYARAAFRNNLTPDDRFTSHGIRLRGESGR